MNVSHVSPSPLPSKEFSNFLITFEKPYFSTTNIGTGLP